MTRCSLTAWGGIRLGVSRIVINKTVFRLHWYGQYCSPPGGFALISAAPIFAWSALTTILRNSVPFRAATFRIMNRVCLTSFATT